MRRHRGVLDYGYLVGGQSPFAMTEELLDRASDAVEALDPDAYQRHIRRVLMQYYDPGEEKFSAWESPQPAPNRPFVAINRRAAVTLQSTHEAGLDVVD
jgi:hypothetical protein